MEQVERPDDGRIRLQEFPHETLHSIPSGEEIETVGAHESRTAGDLAKIDGQEQEHRGGFVELHRMAWDSVAEIDARWPRRRRAVSIVRQSCEETSQPSDRDAHGERRCELRAGRA